MKQKVMKRIVLLTALFFITPSYADFNFGECSGSGTFEQDIQHYHGDFENAVTIGDIPAGIQGLRIDLISNEDVDIRLYGENDDKIVHWPHGILHQAYLATKPYQGVDVTYSGYNGVYGQKGHEFIVVAESTPTAMTMKAFGYRTGHATVNYSWIGKDNCETSSSGSDTFQQAIPNRESALVGTIPPNVNNLYIKLSSDKDIDIQLFSTDGTPIVSWQPAGLLAGPTQQSVSYHGMQIEWSGYNGTDGNAGHEYIKITGLVTEVLVMKVYGYEAGVADVEYHWGNIPITVTNIHSINITQNDAKIVWDVSAYATGQVEYGETTAYGNFNTKETSFNYNHHGQLLKNLNPGTTYHYRVISEDENGQEVISDDYTFATLSVGYAALGSYTPQLYSNNKQGNLKYITYSPEDGINADMPVVMFIKGGGSKTIESYSGIMEFMASKGYYVIGVDVDSYESWYVTKYLEIALNETIAAHGLHASKLVVMGHSLGGGQAFYAMKKFRDDGYGNDGSLALSIDGWFAFNMNKIDLSQLDTQVSFLQMNGIHGTGTDPRINLKIWDLASISNKSFYTLPSNAHGYVAGDLESILEKEDLRLMIGALTDDTFNNSNEGHSTISASNKASYDDIYSALQEEDAYNGGDCAGIQFNAIYIIENNDIDYCTLANDAKNYPPTTNLTARATDDAILKPTLNNPTNDNVYQTHIRVVDKSDTARSSYPKVQNWNSDTTLIRLGNRLYSAGSLEETDITKNKTSGEAYSVLCSRSSDYFRWSNKVANKFFVMNSSYEFVQGEITGNDVNCANKLETFDEYEVVHIGPHEGNIDNEDRYVIFVAKKPNDITLYVILYDIQNTAKVWTKPMPSQQWEWVTVNGSSFWKPSTLDWLSVSQSGKYIVFNNDNGYTDGMYRYDINFENKTKLQYEYNNVLYSEGGHGDLGYDTEGNEVFVQFISGVGVYSFNLDTPTEHGKELLHSPYGGGHVSCRNIKRPGWCYITANTDSNGNGLKDIFALKLDGTGDENVQNFSQTHINNDFEVTYGGPMPDGTKVIFNSHWGTDTEDTFIVEAQ